MTFEADDAKEAVKEAERIIIDNPPENIAYKVPLSQSDVGFLEANIIARMYSEKYSEEQQEVLSGLCGKLDFTDEDKDVCEIEFSFNEINILGNILKADVDFEIDSVKGRPFCRSATRAFLKLNSSFVAVGGRDNVDLREGFERARKRIGVE